MFVDASVILAILLGEDDSALFVEKMKHTSKLYFSAVVRFEAIARLAREKSREGGAIGPADINRAVELVDEFLRRYAFEALPVYIKESDLSIEAFTNYGKGTGHRAQLNMGDCFSYGVARAHKLPLLFKGNDFVHTDIRKA